MITRSLLASLLLVLLLLSPVVVCKKPPSRSAAASGSRRSSAGAANPRGSPAKRRVVVEDEEDDEDDFADDLVGGLPGDDEEDEEDDDFGPQSRRKPPSSRIARNTAVGKKRPPPRSSRYVEEDEYDDYEDDYARRRRGPPTRRGGPPGRGSRPGSVVPYGRGPSQAAAFTRGIAALRSSLPDPEKLKSAAVTSIKAARETTSSLSSNLYRDIKGLTSSELEQVMLKATRPDDTPVKGKHVERLVGVTYQMSSRFDLYDAVLRKLWSKMAEKDWRTTLKALYILHRFASDGAPEHAESLKKQLRQLRRSRDRKGKDKYFNSKQLLAGEITPENRNYRAFMARYAHYVLLRAQCFGGMFDEIEILPKPNKKKPAEPITATCLRSEHLETADMLLKAGLACQLKDGEECENTAIAVERVAADMIALTDATGIALTRALKDDDLKGADPVLIKKWCVFYKDHLQPETRAMVKNTSPKLDAFGLYLPSRSKVSVSRDLLEKGLNLGAGAAPKEEEPTVEEPDDVNEPRDAPVKAPVANDEAVDDEVEEYEYDADEEYYDDEEF